MRRDVFQAIADPTRREIIHVIAGHSLNLNSIAEKFAISRPAISRHIKILTECGLVIIKQKGRERYCETDLTSLNKVSAWIDQYRIFWTSQLDALGDFLQKETPTPRKTHVPAKAAVTRRTVARKSTLVRKAAAVKKAGTPSNKSKRK